LSFFAGGDTGAGYSNVIDYVTTATTGNATDWGDLIATSRWTTGASNTTRGIIAGGFDLPGGISVNRIQYVSTTSSGNATDFGDLLATNYGMGGSASSTRALFGGGVSSSNVIQYVTIATTGNSTDFGDLTVGRGGAEYPAGVSNGHGGLG
jgi:hypothetical protein